MIFDIQRYSVHDGPGIRTVVFFKGCPLRCQWCQNPEALKRSPELGFFLERCVDSGHCREVCPEGAILSGAQRIDRSRCTLCGECVETCHAESLKMIGRDLGVDELLSEVSRDRAFHEDSGGGVTLSGGEPLLQIDFVEEFCARCREAELPVAVETCGAVPFASFQRVLPFVDLFLYDVKAIDASLHEAWTGSKNGIVLSNLERLHEAGAPIIPRVPIIPSYTGLTSNLHQIASYLQGSFEEVHILPYHRWGESKREPIDSAQPSLDLAPPSHQDMEVAKRVFEDRGLAVRLGG
jgi:pyruvate formate lyase activating enzyme